MPHKSLLVAGRFEQHATVVADLFRKRLAVASETKAAEALDDEQVKNLTGGDRLKGRRMREDPWEFWPTHTLIMFSNHKPAVHGRDEGIWRRLRLVPWEVTIPEDERDEHLAVKLAGRGRPASCGGSSTAPCRFHSAKGSTHPPRCAAQPTSTAPTRTSSVGSSPTCSTSTPPHTWCYSIDIKNELDDWCAEQGIDGATADERDRSNPASKRAPETAAANRSTESGQQSGTASLSPKTRPKRRDLHFCHPCHPLRIRFRNTHTREGNPRWVAGVAAPNRQQTPQERHMTVHHRDDRVTVHHGDALDVLSEMPGSSVDAVITDPPYALSFRGNDWDAMHPNPLIWRQCLRVLQPGAPLISFGGARTWHRLACDIEDAGLEIRGSIAWLFSDGLAKSKNSLKPAHNPIIWARKPGPIIPLDIDATRNSSGRWPTDVVLDEHAAAALDTGDGTSQGGRLDRGGLQGAGPRGNHVYGAETKDRGPWTPYGDSGGASRFFPTFKYQGKAPARERPVVNGVRHSTVKPLELMRWLVRLVTPLSGGGVVLDPFAGSGTTAEASSAGEPPVHRDRTRGAILTADFERVARAGLQVRRK